MPRPVEPQLDSRDAERQGIDRPGLGLVHPCPCGRGRELHECCLPLAVQLRDGPSEHPLDKFVDAPHPEPRTQHEPSTHSEPGPHASQAGEPPTGSRTGPFGGRRPGSPVGELRASTALLLWGLLSHRSGEERLRSAHSLAARVFWGTIMHVNPIWAAGGAADGGYGRELFERLWGKVEPSTRTWMLGALPPAFRADSTLGTLGLDWLLWDAPWLGGHPAGRWLGQSSFLGRGEHSRRILTSLLESRVGLFQFEQSMPGIGLRLRDTVTGSVTVVNTPTPHWNHQDRILALRVFQVGDWRIAAGDGLLLPSTTATEVLQSLETLRAAHRAPSWPAPGWSGWSKSWLLPLLARHLTQHRMSQWVAHPTQDRYH